MSCRIGFFGIRFRGNAKDRKGKLQKMQEVIYIHTINPWLSMSLCPLIKKGKRNEIKQQKAHPKPITSGDQSRGYENSCLPGRLHTTST